MATYNLLVEGPDDRHFIAGLLEKRGVILPKLVKEGSKTIIHLNNLQVAVKEKGGYENLRDTLDVELQESDLAVLGIVVDADEKIQSRWESLHHHLTQLGYKNLPSNLNEDGLIFDQELMPKLGVWLMPNNQVNGMLEDFIQFLVPNQGKNVLLEIAQTTVRNLPAKEQLPANEAKRFSPTHESKAVIHTWLAWQEPPGRPFGVAITNKALDTNAPEAIHFVNWLQKLFS